MRNRILGVLLTAAVGVSPLVVRADAPAPADKPKYPFAEPLLAVATELSQEYYEPIPLGRLIQWSVRGLYRRVGRDVSPEIGERLQWAGALKPNELRDLLADVREEVLNPDSRHYIEKMSDDLLFNLAFEAMCARLDEGTRLLYGGPRLNTEPLGQPSGVGLRLRADPSTGLIEVVTPIFGGPAYKAGLRAGDLITQITPLDSQHPQAASTKGMSAAATSRRLMGKLETKIRVTARRPGEAKEKEYTLVRDLAGEEAIAGVRRQADDRWNYWLDADKKIAYVRIVRPTTRDGIPEYDDDINETLAALDKNGLKGLILDLRFARDGLFSAAVEVSDLLIDDGVIASIRSRGRTVETLTGKHEGSRLNFPVVCLVNGKTARVAEVVAACLQDHHRAVVMGERTMGDCLIRNIRDFSPLGKFRIATGGLYRPDGRKLYRTRPCDGQDDEWGVTPDAKYVFTLTPKERDELADDLDRQTFIRPHEQAPADKARMKDRQLEMALAYLRSHGG